MEINSTSHLDKILAESQLEALEQLEFPADDISFYRYIDEIIELKGLKRQDVILRADMPQKYGYKLLSGEKHTGDRDKLLRIFVAMGMNLKEVNRALKLYGMPILYSKRKRDAVIIAALNKGVSSVEDLNSLLEQYGVPPLTSSPA